MSGIHIIHINDGYKGLAKTLHFGELGGLRDVECLMNREKEMLLISKRQFLTMKI